MRKIFEFGNKPKPKTKGAFGGVDNRYLGE